MKSLVRISAIERLAGIDLVRAPILCEVRYVVPGFTDLSHGGESILDACSPTSSRSVVSWKRIEGRTSAFGGFGHSETIANKDGVIQH